MFSAAFFAMNALNNNINYFIEKKREIKIIINGKSIKVNRHL